MFENVVGSDQMVVQRYKIVNRDVNEPVVLLVTKRFFCPVDFDICVAVFIVKGLVLLVQVLLEELFGQVR